MVNAKKRKQPAGVVVSRAFKASRHRVFRAWTEPELLMKWFVDSDGEISACRMDLREGGEYRLEGTVGDKPWAIWGKYLEVAASREARLHLAVGQRSRARGAQGDTVVTVEFRDRGAETELVVTHERFATARARDEHAEGWKGCLDRLGPARAKRRSVMMSFE